MVFVVSVFERDDRPEQAVRIKLGCVDSHSHVLVVHQGCLFVLDLQIVRRISPISFVLMLLSFVEE